MNQHADKQCIKQITDYVLNNCGNEKNKKQITQLFSTQRVGLLVTDRVVNLPLDVVPPLYNELLKDMEYSRKQALVNTSSSSTASSKSQKPQGNKKQQQQQQQPTVVSTTAQNKPWDFTYFVLISPCSDAASAGGVGNKNAKKNKKDQQGDNATEGGSEDVWYTRFEDEFFSRHATMIRKVQTSQTRPWMETGKLPVQNMIMVLNKDALVKVRDHLANVIGIGGEENFF
jgi:hypothetical protein